MHADQLMHTLDMAHGLHGFCLSPQFLTMTWLHHITQMSAAAIE